jgi:hypothetical protein
MKHEHLDETPDEHESQHESPRDREIDDALGQALRAEDPGAAFTQRVLARAREERAAQQSGRPLHAIGMGASASASAEASTEVSGGTPAEVSSAAELTSTQGDAHPPRVRATRLTATRKLVAAIAASLTLMAAGAQYVQHRRYVAEGESARAQVLAALRLTNEKLNLVHDKITEREHAR